MKHYVPKLSTSLSCYLTYAPTAKYIVVADYSLDQNKAVVYT